MNKKLITLAILAVSGASFAQSQVSAYGVADVWLGRTGGSHVPSQTKLESGGLSKSRFGLKGVEDLGGGSNVNFVLEQGFDMDTGAVSDSTAANTLAFDRQSYVGFLSGTGEFRLGKTWTPFDDVSSNTHPAFDSTLSPQNGVWVSTNYQANPANTVYYATPNLGGFSGALSLSLGEDKDTPNQGKASSVTAYSAQYADDCLYVGLAYQSEKAQGDDSPNVTFKRVNASYDLGVAKILIGYGRTKNLGLAPLPSRAWSLPAYNAYVQEWEIGADIPLSSQVTLSGGIAKSTDNEDALSNGAVRRGYGVATTYAVSPRTTVYGGINENKWSEDGAEDVTNRTTAMGVKHNF